MSDPIARAHATIARLRQTGEIGGFGLTDTEVREIADLHGSTSAPAVAEAYGVSESHVRKIWSGESRSDITGRRAA